MQTDRGIYNKRVCDRCGETVGGKAFDPEEVFSEWGWRQDIGDLCPDCYAEYKKLIAKFRDCKNKRREVSK